MKKYIDKIIIFLDRAHGSDVAGKRSPDGTHIEWIWSSFVCNELKVILEAIGYEVKETNPTDKEIGLAARRSFVENYKTSKMKILISPHNNGAGDGTKWMNARGFEIWTRQGFDNADILAEYMFKRAKQWFPDVKHRYALDKDYQRDKEGKLYMTNSSKYFGVLLEWGFQDNKDDVAMLKNERLNKAFVDMIVDSIEDFCSHVFNK